jgi:hypothetical protein
MLDVTKKSNSSASLPTLKKDEEEDAGSDSDDSETKKQRKVEHKRTQSEGVYRKSVGVGSSGLSKRSSRILVEEETSSEDDQEFITKNKKGKFKELN